MNAAIPSPDSNAAPAAAGHSTRAPRFESWLCISDAYTVHQDTRVHGIHLTDTHHNDGRCPKQDLIWVGFGGMDGRWLKPEEVLDIAAAMTNMAECHTLRVFREQMARRNSNTDALVAA